METKRLEVTAEGKKVYDFSVGTPDFKPEESSMKALMEAAKDPDKFKYAIADLPELKEAVQGWYKRRYNVDLEEDEIMSVSGSQ